MLYLLIVGQNTFGQQLQAILTQVLSKITLRKLLRLLALTEEGPFVNPIKQKCLLIIDNVLDQVLK